MSTVLLPSAANLLSIVLTLLLAFTFLCIGAAIGGRQRKPEMDVLVGWGVTCFYFSAAGILTPISFLWFDALFLLGVCAAIFTVIHHKLDLHLHEIIPLLVLALPFILVASTIMPNMWDELSHWLPNTLYLLDNQHFPGDGRPASISGHADYPYGLPLVMYGVEMAARALGTSVWQSGVTPAFNLLLMVVAAHIIITLARTERGSDTKPIPRWFAASIALIAVTIACPAFVPHLVLSAYPDSATSVVLLAIGAMLVSDARNTSTHILQCAILLVLAFCLREDNGLTALFMLGSAGLWQWGRGEPFRLVLKRSIIICLPMLILALGWHLYIAKYIPGSESTYFRQISEWNTQLLGSILNGYMHTILRKGGFFVLAFLITYFAVQQWFKPSHAYERSGMLAGITSITFISYNVFLLFIYLSMFTPYLAGQAASLWRYNTHLGLLQIAVVAMLLARALPSFDVPKSSTIIVLIAVLIAPLAFDTALRADQTPFIKGARQIGTEVNDAAPGTEKLVFIDLNKNGRDGLDCLIIQFQLKHPERLTNCINELSPEVQMVDSVAKSHYILVDGWAGSLSALTHLTLPDTQTYLLVRTGNGWSEVHSWPRIPEGK